MFSLSPVVTAVAGLAFLVVLLALLVTNNLVQTMEMLKATTGLDVESLIQKYSTTNGSTPGLAAASTTDGPPSS